MNIETLKEYLDYNKDTGIFLWKKQPANCIKVGDVAGKSVCDRYSGLQFKGKRYMAHRVAWAMHYGEFPKDQIDHINGNPHDNRIENLRCVSPFENMRNLSMHRKGKLFGAHLVRGKWHSSFSYKGKSHFVGVFDSDKEAQAACLGYIKAKGWIKTMHLNKLLEE